MNEGNMRPPGRFKENPELAREAGRKGAEARKKKMTMREAMKRILDADIQDDAQKLRMAKAFGLEVDDLTNQDLLLTVVFQKALKGDMQAVKFIQEASGNKLAERVEISAPVGDTADKVKAFFENE